MIKHIMNHLSTMLMVLYMMRTMLISHGGSTTPQTLKMVSYSTTTVNSVAIGNMMKVALRQVHGGILTIHLRVHGYMIPLIQL